MVVKHSDVLRNSVDFNQELMAYSCSATAGPSYNLRILD